MAETLITLDRLGKAELIRDLEDKIKLKIERIYI